MEHYITEIRIDELRHLSNIVISLNPDKRQHLIITGQNGSGKTSLLLALQKCLKAVNDGKLEHLNDFYSRWSEKVQKNPGCKRKFGAWVKEGKITYAYGEKLEVCEESENIFNLNYSSRQT